MLIKELYTGKSIKELLARQNKMHPQVIPIDGEIAANSNSANFKVSIGNSGHFVVDEITGNYETLESIGNPPAITDTGRCLISVIIKDMARQKSLCTDYVSCDLLFTPGRRKGLADASAIPNQLFYPLRFPYIFEANTDIGLDFTNRSNVAIKFSFAFVGLRVLK